MIKDISIRNFKGLENINIENLGHITLISGKNNTGKSSLLEALFLHMDHVSNDSFAKINNFRGNYVSDVLSMWEPLFFDLDTTRQINIDIVDDNNTSFKLLYKKDENYLPASVEGVPDNILAQFRAATKNAYSLLFHFASKKYSEAGHFFLNGGGVLRQMETSLPGNEIQLLRPTQFINSALARTDTVIEGIGKLELSGRKEYIVNVLKELDPEIEDIVTVSRQSITQLYIKTDNKWLPLQYAGDGVLKLLSICIALFERSNGLLLIDEIETGFHYSMYGKLWRILDKISRETNCQIIATTHSYELIESVRNNITDPEQFVYYRLGDNKGVVHAYRYDYSMLESALISEMEVR